MERYKVSLEIDNTIYRPALEADNNKQLILFLGNNIPAGFPSPARDYIEDVLDLNELMIDDASATYFVRVEGYSMSLANIFPGDILVVDRGKEAYNNNIVIAVIDGELTVKRLKIIKNEYWLYPENNDYKPFKIEEWMDFLIWGIVTWVIHKPN
ncbi:MAG: translesion error-prone DNA polymerase V autoproteolytic subunit [Candidatus Cloacimonetes bacterium]|jgi:DNA polymerase V|nr:translesion error-prone DNA polymerase V autoproteolytic subunit [Candidatus Cloacimonadota bacterium]MDD4157027.1 translesion error-prone DNA polymerase V autoproteolytic subunit [Candidatus Cloacimonadota bacterium]